MILLIPFTRFTIKTHLHTDEAEQRLAAHVEPRKFRRRFSRNHLFFEGAVKNGKFNINRILIFSGYKGFQPIITGQIHNDLEASKIEITMRLDHSVVVFLVGFSLLSFIPFFEGGIGIGPVLSLFGFGVFFFWGIFTIPFNYGANKARRYLEEIFQVHV